MRECWKWVIDWKGFYQVSNAGRVRSVDRVVRHWRGGPSKRKGKILVLSPNKWGYLKVDLSSESVLWPKHIHQLVAEAWIGPCPKGKEVCHGKKGILDNSLSNLSYGTKSENGLDRRRDGTHCGRAVRRSDGKCFTSMTVAGEESGCNFKGIWKVCNSLAHTAGGFGWEYA